MRAHVPIEIVTCPQWDAMRPLHGLQIVGQAGRIIFHHTAGHHPEIANPRDESRAEAVSYAQRIQTAHMVDKGWVDSGHNFLVCRNGDILQGRWLTVSAIEAGKMVRSAHCPGQNDQIGIEHEHQAYELMPAAQRESSAQLQAWIAASYRRRWVLPVDPHRAHFSTACPGNIGAAIPAIRARAQQILNGAQL